MKNLRMPKYSLILVDAMNFCNYNFYGMKNHADSEGRKTGMLYGVARFFITCRKRYKNARVVYLWEGKRSWRRGISGTYKANRDNKGSVDNDIMNSLADVQYVLTPMGIDQERWGRMEADDLAAYYVNSKEIEDRILLVTKDQDWLVLLEPLVDILRGNNIVTVEDAENELGFPVERMTLYKMLTGDASDNVKGVYRFRRDLAVRLCQVTGDYREIPALLKSWGEEAWSEKVKDQMELLSENLKLVSMLEEVASIPIECVPGVYDRAAVMEFLSSRSMEKTVKRISLLE